MSSVGIVESRRRIHYFVGKSALLDFKLSPFSECYMLSSE